MHLKKLNLVGFALVILFSAACSEPKTPLTPRQKNVCADLNEQECASSQRLIQKSCEWNAVCKDAASLEANFPVHTAEELLSYLEAPNIPAAVKALADKGEAVYQNSSSELAQARLKKGKKTFASRDMDWITKTFGQDESAIINEFKKIEAPATWTIGEITKAHTKEISQNKPDESVGIPHLTLVSGFNVTQLPEAKLASGLLQLASQFNYLESPGTSKTTVSLYIRDSTQGPAGSVEAAAAALHRTAAEAAQKLPHSLFRILPANHERYYKNGYFMLFKINQKDELSQLKNLLESKIEKMEILPQWAIYEATGKVQLQVLAAAPSYQGAGTPAYLSTEGQICDLLVSTQYEALAKMAVIMSVLMNKEIPVHLTMVGQGVFNNPPEVMKSSLEKVAQVIKGYPKVRVFIHAHSSNEQDKIRKFAQESSALYSFSELSAEDFLVAD